MITWQTISQAQPQDGAGAAIAPGGKLRGAASSRGPKLPVARLAGAAAISFYWQVRVITVGCLPCCHPSQEAWGGGQLSPPPQEPETPGLHHSTPRQVADRQFTAGSETEWSLAICPPACLSVGPLPSFHGLPSGSTRPGEQ